MKEIFRIAGFSVLLMAPIASHSIAQQPQRQCYQLEKVVRPVDATCDWNFCKDWRNQRTYSIQGDGTITFSPNPGFGRGAQWIVHDTEATSTTDDHHATVHYEWTPPPQTLCSDQSARISESVGASDENAFGGIQVGTSPAEVMAVWTVETKL